MTANELKKVLDYAVAQGHGDVEVLFDSEAQKFKVHMVHIKSAYLNEADVIGYPFISLHFDFEGQVE